MTDMRRTLLWVVFTMSLVLLWDAWNKHTGQPTIFGGPSRPAASAPARARRPGASGGVPAAIAGAAATGAPAAVPTAAAVPDSERVTVTTDVVRATFDTRGGSLVGLELLGYKDQADETRPVRLMDQSGQRVYLAQTGLIAAQGAAPSGVALPNHLTPMTLLPGERTLADGAKSVAVAFEATSADGSKLVKTYTFERGRYLVGVKHEFVNAGAAPVAPQLYLQLARDGNPPEGESAFYFTFTGPAIYTDASKFKKIDFKDIEKGKAEHDKQADNGWIAMVQHYFTSAWLLPPGTAREFRTAKVADNLYSVAMVTPLGEVAPGASTSFEAQLYAGPQEEYRLAALAPGPGPGQGLRLADGAVQAAVLAADPAAHADRQLGLGHRRPGRAAEDRLLLAQRQGLCVDGQDEGHQPEGHGDARAAEGQAAADAAGDDAHLPRGKGQPARRLPADPGADALLHRAVLGAAVAAWRCATRRGSAGSPTWPRATPGSSCRS